MKLNLALNGVSDQPPWAAGDRYTSVVDCTFRNGFARRVRGDTSALTVTPPEARHLVNMFNLTGGNWWLIAGTGDGVDSDGIYAWDGADQAPDDITPADLLTLAGKDEYTSGVLN
ncbi:unnamed protein product, partial [marine sediment metagenome]